MTEKDESKINIMFSVLFIIIILALFSLAGLFIAGGNQVNSARNKYIPISGPTYKLTPRKKAYVYQTPAKRKRIFTLKPGQAIYIPTGYLVSDNYGGQGEGDLYDPIVIGKKHIKFGKNKKGLAPIMMVTKFNHEEYANGDSHYAAKQMWRTRMFIDLKQFKVKYYKHINLYKKGQSRNLALIDTCKPHVFNPKHNKKGQDDDDNWWLPIYIQQQNNNVLLNSEDDNNAMHNTNEDDNEIDSNTTKDPSNEAEENDDDENNGGSENTDDDDDTNAADDDDTTTTDDDTTTTGDDAATTDTTTTETTTTDAGGAE